MTAAFGVDTKRCIAGRRFIRQVYIQGGDVQTAIAFDRIRCWLLWHVDNPSNVMTHSGIPAPHCANIQEGTDFMVSHDNLETLTVCDHG